MLERLNKKIKRRTRVASIFPNTESCLRLVSAVAMETSEDWGIGKKYLAPRYIEWVRVVWRRFFLVYSQSL
jgi:transposase-like protein